MIIEMKPTSDVVIEVTPRNAGNFGCFRISGQERTPQQEYRLAEEIESNIKRHVDDIEGTYLKQEMVYVDDEGNEYETLFDLLNDMFNEDTEKFTYRYKRPNDTYGTQDYTFDFTKLIEEAFRNPHNFEVLNGNLTEGQKKFLDAVIESGKESSIKWR